MPQEPTRPPTSSPRRLATAEEHQRVLTAYERGDDWLTVARYNKVFRSQLAIHDRFHDSETQHQIAHRVAIPHFSHQPPEATLTHTE
ncbi:hypothetical protein PI125_g7398 [Phytophthora idaei]|nr:hypothetical protein PI125_g7398 [Phytophthora idaei]